MSEIVQQIADGIHRYLGLYIQPSQRSIAMRAVEKAAAELGWGIQPEYWAYKLQDKLTEEEVRALARHVTIGETYFFREKPAIAFFRQIIIPEIIRRRQHNQAPYRIWSAACSSGEEPYTLAMLIYEHMRGVSANDVTILATDINPDALNKARTGTYTAWSFRETEESVQKKYFTKEGKFWVIRPEIRKLVQFAHLNLVSDVFPSASNGTAGLDLIFCRNVLMYFDKETIQRIAGQLENCLVHGGWLVTSQVELNEDYFGRFGKIAHAGGFFYRKIANEFARQPYQAEIKKTTETPLLRSKSTSALRPAAQRDKDGRSGRSLQVEPKAERASLSTVKISKETEPAGHVSVPAVSDKQADRERIRAMADEGRLAEALPLATAFCREAKADADDFFMLASVQMACGLFDEAEESLTRSLYLQPEMLEARFQLAFVLQKNGKHEAAQRQLKLLLKALKGMPADLVVFGGMQVAALIDICKVALSTYDGNQK